MNPDYVQNLRYKLQKRVRRLNSVEYDSFYYSLKYFLEFVRQHPVIRGVLERVLVQFPDTAEEINEAFSNNQSIVGVTEIEHVAISYLILSRWGDSEKQDLWMHESMRFGLAAEHNVRLDKIRQLFLEPLYEYIDEQLDDSRAILSLLVRYKHRCEWFRRDHLNKMFEENTGKGEKLLALDLYEYLHDQGLNFTIEPHSASGIPDLIADQRTDDPLIADAKVFDPSHSKGTSYITKGFNQIYIYTRDFNEPFGYLVIFRLVVDDLKFDVSGTNMSVPFVTHNGKTIFLLVVDICKYETSASKRGELKCYEIKEDEFIQVINEKADGVDMKSEVPTANSTSSAEYT